MSADGRPMGFSNKDLNKEYKPSCWPIVALIVLSILFGSILWGIIVQI